MHQVLSESKQEKIDQYSVKGDLSNMVFTRWYRPPEAIMMTSDYNQSADIWSLGCVLAEMMSSTTQYKEKKKHLV